MQGETLVDEVLTTVYVMCVVGVCGRWSVWEWGWWSEDYALAWWN